MRKVLRTARYTFTEIFRNRVYYVLVLFAIVMLGAILLLSTLGGEQRNRMILDFGLTSIESFSLLVAVFAAVTLVLEEMESRTLYLILSRPVARYQFVLGRFLGLISLLTLTYGVMAGGHLALLGFVHIHPDTHYFLSLIFSWEKIVMITAVALAFSLFATSTVSAVAFTFFFWIMGHFSGEIRYLAQKTSKPALTVLFELFYYLAPNFQFLNLRDLPSASSAGTGWLWPAFGYGLSYTAACLAMVILLFRKKEF
jgi:ABC-type transport system involved in multi-copper enzyme maturation permease subunit